MTNKGLILLDLFSGTGGFHKGLTEAGFDFKEVYYSEIDKHAIANYKYNYPNAKHIGSVNNILQSGIPRPHVITFGSPCQDFSLAGNRKGLAGDKSSLIQEAITAITHYRPDIFIWENVKGTFSSNAGSDFWAIIQAFANIGGYDIEWQLVNTSWLLPQNRERIYLVGHLTESCRDWRTVFPVTETFRQIDSEREERTTELSIRPNRAGSLRINHAGRIFKGQDGIVVYDNGLCPAICIGHGVVPKILIPSANKQAVIQLNSSTESNGKQPYQHNRVYAANGLCPALNTDTRPPAIKEIIQLNQSNHWQGSTRQTDRVYSEKGIMACLQQSRTDDKAKIFTANKIRRLTEIECERLQGFPDNWTKYGNYDGIVKEVPKTQRYKLLGNAVTAKMVELIGSRLITNFKRADAIRVSLHDEIADNYKQAA